MDLTPDSQIETATIKDTDGKTLNEIPYWSNEIPVPLSDKDWDEIGYDFINCVVLFEPPFKWEGNFSGYLRTLVSIYLKRDYILDASYCKSCGKIGNHDTWGSYLYTHYCYSNINWTGVCGNVH